MSPAAAMIGASDTPNERLHCSGLPFGTHELTLTVSGSQSSLSSGPAIEVNGFNIGLTRDQRPLYAGGLLLLAGALILGWQGLRGPAVPRRPTTACAAG